MDTNHHPIEIHRARTIGAFFLLAFLAYGLGRHLFESQSIFEQYIGASLILANSLMVLFIGIFLGKTLQKVDSMVGNIYLFTRIFEALALSSILFNLLPNVGISLDGGYFLAMLVLGIGSIPMCLTLYKHRICPSWMALWGVVGYAVFAFGFLMELFGQEWSMYLLIPGGLWELAFAIWLILKGRR